MIFKATKQHAQNLATFALIYKSICLTFRSANDGKERSLDSFIAGLVGGYYVFGRKKTAVSQQIVIYVFARVCLAFAALAIQPPGDNTLVGSRYGGRGGMGILKISDDTRARIQRSAWPAFASLSWAFVMWLFKYEHLVFMNEKQADDSRWYPDMLQSSLASSMKYMYVWHFLLHLSLRLFPRSGLGLAIFMPFLRSAAFRARVCLSPLIRDEHSCLSLFILTSAPS